MTFPFNKGCAPDLPEFGHEFLVKARNCYSGILGYEPIKALSVLTAALPYRWRGSGAFSGADGTIALLAGTDNGLYRLSSTTATSISASTYSAPWFFVQFGDKVICLNGGAPLKYTISAGTAATLGGSPPTCQFGAIVADFVFVGGNSSNQNRVYWSDIDNAEFWTAGINQSDIQDLPDGGPLTGLSGGEYGLAYQDEAIHIFEYAGLPTIFNRRKVSNSIGALCHGGIARVGMNDFFYSRRGFYKFTPGADPVPIGRNKVDRTFRNTYSVSDIVNNLRCSIDPERSLVIWAMPDRLWVYNYDNDMWSDIAVTGIVGISTGQTASLTLEDIAATFPSIEDVTPSFDDPFWRGGAPLVTVAMNDGKLYAFGASDNMEAQFRLPQLELNPGRVSHLRNSRIIGNVASAQVSIDCRARMGDNPLNVVSTDLRANGEVPIRASGRFVQPEVILSAGTDWSSIQGFDAEATAGGRN